MTLTADIRELVGFYGEIVRRDGREEAEVFVTACIVAPPHTCERCGMDVPAGWTHDCIRFPTHYLPGCYYWIDSKP